MKRKILTIKNKEELSISELILFQPYKNIVSNFYDLAINKEAIHFDAVSRNFSGIDNADSYIRDYYEAMLGVTSYYQASKGGRGKYIEKKIASISESCVLDFSMSEFPKFLTIRNILRKKKLYGDYFLSKDEKKDLRTHEWDFISNYNCTTDLINLLPNKISFLELKNRVDSGGVSARREIWIKKFPYFFEYFKNNMILFKFKEKEYTLYDFLTENNINTILLNIGLLFNVSGEPATKEGDKSKGFYSSNEEGYKFIKKYIEDSNVFSIVEDNIDNLFLKIKYEDIIIEIRAVYGNDIPVILLEKNIDINDLLLNPYDDIWLFQLLSIEQRADLLKNDDNLLLKIDKLIKSNYSLRLIINEFINEEGNNIEKLTDLVSEINNDNLVVPHGREKIDYIHDIIYFYCANY